MFSSRKSPRRGIIALLLLIGGVIALTSSSLALFTDSETVLANTFSVGSIDLATSPTSTVVTLSGAVPGSQVTAALTVSNPGSATFRYAVTSTTTENTLAAQLDLTIKVGVTTCTDGGFGADGTVVYTTGDLGSTTGVDVIGSPATGADVGDRTITAAGSEILCFNVTLPTGTGDTFQGTTSTASFVFAAEQTDANP
jgi:spore coat-associated protein N